MDENNHAHATAASHSHCTPGEMSTPITTSTQPEDPLNGRPAMKNEHEPASMFLSISRATRYKARYVRHLSVLAGVTAWLCCRWFFHRQLEIMTFAHLIPSSQGQAQQQHQLPLLVVCRQLYEGLWGSLANAWSMLEGTRWFFTPLILMCLLLSSCHETISKWLNSNNSNAASSTITATSPLGFLSRYKRGCSKHANNRGENGYSSSVAYSASSSSSSSQRQMALSHSEPFVSTDIIQDMTLRDIAHVFCYASRVNHAGFDRQQFYAEHDDKIRSVTRTVLEALDQAMATSRGPKTELTSIVPSDASSDSMDALAFCGAVRIFAEWRSLRCIPQGYGKYAFGMNMSHRDVCQNVQKVEEAVHEMLMTEQAAAHNGEEVATKVSPQQSPTLRDVLQYEVKSNHHPKLPILSDRSAGSGVLWVQRQITYYGSTLENSALVPLHFPDPRSAYLAAYEKVYGPYHGFLTRTMILTTIDSCPTEYEMRREMNAPYNEEDDTEEQDQPLVTKLSVDEDDYATEDEEDCLSMSSFSNVVSCGSGESLRQQAAQELVYEDNDDDDEATEQEMELGDKIFQIFSLVFGLCVDPAGSEGGHDSSRDAIFNHQKQIDESSTTKPQRNDVPFFLSSMRPLEEGWINVLEELNINDPTRV
mmetsp:Transcript_30003/g.69982  ORF Transcript_30003/g.69982 Transcript_30003/m.69982 type:complete len:647 (-) Transcript_30003:1185-3125(-)